MSSDGPPSFRYFCRLPTELRWMIWEWAIDTDITPQIHYYSLFNTDDGHRKSALQDWMRAHPPDEQPYPRNAQGSLLLIHPRQLRSRPAEWSWADANRFENLWNAGLETACRESRWVLLERRIKAKMREYKRLMFLPGAPALPEPTALAWFDTTMTKLPRPTDGRQPDAVLARHTNGEPIIMQVRTRRDIVCLEACVRLRWEKLVEYLPVFRLSYAADINLALEFDPSWNDGLRIDDGSVMRAYSEASPRGLAIRAHVAWERGELPQRARLWLLDRSPKEPPHKDWMQRDPVVHRDHRRHFPVTPYDADGSYQNRVQKNYLFSDGRDRFVVCVSRNGRLFACVNYHSPKTDVLLQFVWNVRFCRLITPDEVVSNTTMRPLTCTSETFFRPLRQVRDHVQEGGGGWPVYE